MVTGTLIMNYGPVATIMLDDRYCLTRKPTKIGNIQLVQAIARVPVPKGVQWQHGACKSGSVEVVRGDVE